MRSRKSKQRAGKRHNAVAADLRTPKYRQRVVKSKKVYDRKRKPLDANSPGGLTDFYENSDD